jgi:hypothetical protein
MQQHRLARNRITNGLPLGGLRKGGIPTEGIGNSAVKHIADLCNRFYSANIQFSLCRNLDFALFLGIFADAKF